MMGHTEKSIQLQRRYYEETASQYDEWHQRGGAHEFALFWLIGLIKQVEVKSILDVGAGTGRLVQFVRSQDLDVDVIGLEPSKSLREVGFKKGVKINELVDGDAMDLTYDDGSFDLVCATGALHHIPDPRRAISEMIRVSRKAILVSDGNNFGQGGFFARSLKQCIDLIRLWKAFDYVRTKGKGYHVSEGDGVYYSYSIFNDYDFIAQNCHSVHIMNAQKSGRNLYRSAGSIVLLGIK
jgi:SAM-dependent methyltransferase